MFYSYFDYSFITLAVFVTVFVGLNVLFSVLMRIIFGKSRRGADLFLFPLAAVLAFAPFRAKLPFGGAGIKGFDLLLWVENIRSVLSEPLGPRMREFTNERRILTLSGLLMIIWLTVSLISIFIEISKYIRLKKDVKKYSRECTDKAYLNILKAESGNGKIPSLRIYEKCRTPFAMGFFHPVILIPSEDFPEDEITMIIRHELCHISRKDILLKIFMMIFRSFNWFNPFVYIMCRQTSEDAELSADEKVTSDMSYDEKKKYTELIVKTASENKISDMSTYLSTSGKRLKKRIDGVLESRTSSVFPVMFSVMFMIFTYFMIYPVNADSVIDAAYLIPIPIENDPYIEKLDKTVTAESYEDAAVKIFSSLMDSYCDKDVPDYYRLEQYNIIGSYDAAELMPDVFEVPQPFGIFNSINTHIITIAYTMETANKCGNTCHDLPTNLYPPGTIFSDIAFEINRNENEYTLKNVGLAFGYAGNADPYSGNPPIYTYDENYHFRNTIPYIESRYSYLSAAFEKDSGDPDEIWDQARAEPDKYKFEYCGCEYNPDGTYMIFGNVYSDEPHGVKVYCGQDNATGFTFPTMIKSVECVKLFPSIEYTDTFDKISFADIPGDVTAENAERRLQYMMTPRDGTDFTVTAYKNITEKDGGIYADVRFRGRLEGNYAADVSLSQGNIEDWYLEDVRIM